MPQEFENQVEGIKKSLRTQYPKWNEKQINSSAYAIARKRWITKYGEDPLK